MRSTVLGSRATEIRHCLSLRKAKSIGTEEHREMIPKGQWDAHSDSD